MGLPPPGQRPDEPSPAGGARPIGHAPIGPSASADSIAAGSDWPTIPSGGSSKISIRKTDTGRGYARSCYPSRVDRLREIIYWTLEQPDSGSYVPQLVTRSVAATLVGAILMSLTCMVLETSPDIDEVTPPAFWRSVEIGTTVIFTLEYVLRLWVCDLFGTSAITWALRGINICDLLSIVPVWADLAGSSSDRGSLKWLRVLRVSRLFKLGRYSPGVHVMLTALSNSMSALNILFFLILTGMVVFASAVYYAERLNCPVFDRSDPGALDRFRSYNELCSGAAASLKAGCCLYSCNGLGHAEFKLCAYPASDTQNTTDLGSWQANPAHEVTFRSIPHGMWWACVTIATVGYGDLVPTFWGSKVIAGLSMVCGLLIIAMPFAIVGAKLSEAMATYTSDAAAAANSRKRWRHGTSRFDEEVQPELLTELLEDIRDSFELKTEIMRLQELRDNLWTSIEHAMATLAFEGLASLDKELLLEHPRSFQFPGDEEEVDGGRSLFIFSRDSRIRMFALWLTKWVVFDCCVMVAIVLNSVILMMQDYYPHEESAQPWANKMQDKTDTAFIIWFAFECVLKIIAQGFILGRGSYLRDGWNWIDITVVLSGLFSMVVPSGGSLTFIRTVRVLRPLRTFSAMPGLRNLFNTILRSLPGLRDVVLMGIFIMLAFGILGLHLFGGIHWRHCRVLPQPVHFTSRANSPTCQGWCFDSTSLAYQTFCAPLPKCAAAYAAGRDYWVWPVDPQQSSRLCGEYQCAVTNGLNSMAEAANVTLDDLVSEIVGQTTILGVGAGGLSSTWCGSGLHTDYRFAPKLANGTLDGVDMDDDWDYTAIQNLNYGYQNYNNLFWGIFVVFQCSTLEAWTDAMYQLQDASPSIVGFMFQMFLVIICAFFLLNIVLAIVWDAFMDVKAKASERGEDDPTSKVQQLARAAALSQATPAEDVIQQSEPVHRRPTGKDGLYASLMEMLRIMQVTLWAIVTPLVFKRNSIDPEHILREDHPWRPVRWARTFARSEAFQALIICVITMNVVVLSMDQFPKKLWPARVVLRMGEVFNMVFFCEFLVMNVAVLPLRYWSDNALAFDGIIVIISAAEYVADMMSERGKGGGSSVTALRAFRLLRILKLAKKLRSMRILLKASVETLLGMRDFVMLLFLIICIFALVGQSFFGGKFLFDDSGAPVRWSTPHEFWEKCPIDGRRPKCVPRQHFDSFIWSFSAVFQIMSTENWNNIMYDGMRATDDYMFLYFWAVMIFGNFIILNLFLAYLMHNFHAKQGAIASAENSKGVDRKALRLVDIVYLVKAQTYSLARETAAGFSPQVTGNLSGVIPNEPVEAAGNRGFVGSFIQRFCRGPNAEEEELVADTGRGSVAAANAPAAVDESDAKEALARNEDEGRGSVGRPRSDSEPASPRSTEDIIKQRAFALQRGFSGAMASLFGSKDEEDDEEAIPQAGSASLSVGARRVSIAAFTKQSLTLDQEQAEAERRTRLLKTRSGHSLRGRDDEDDDDEDDVRESRRGLSGDILSSCDDSEDKGGMIDEVSGSGLQLQKAAAGQAAPESSDVPSIEALLPRFVTRAVCWKVVRQRTCFIFPQSFPLRRLCIFLIENPRFDQFIISIILVSSLMMMFQSPLNNPNGWLESTCAFMNLVFTGIFLMEMLVKIMARGLLCGHHGRPAYLQSSWNILDCFIVIISVIDAVLSGTGGRFTGNKDSSSSSGVSGNGGSALAFMKIFRIARMLRPLRLISRNENLKVVIKTIGSSLPQLRILLLFCLLFFLIFALLGVSIFKGSLYQCRSLDPESGLSSMDINQSSVTMPLCIPPTASASYGLRVIQGLPADAATCPDGWEAYQRDTDDTPICEVHCDGDHASNHPFCQNTIPWGYNLMRCTDCRDAFCPGASSPSCRKDCADPLGNDYFCRDRTDPVAFQACVDQCEAECICEDSCVGLVKDAARCVEQGGIWINSDRHFDTLIAGMISLFEISTTEGWVDFMLNCVDSRAPYVQPRRDENEWIGVIMFISFILLGSFFVLNLCVGVIVDNYHKERGARGRLMVTEAQMHWISFQKALFVKKQFFLQTNLHRLSPTRAHLIRIVTSVAFERVIMVCIIVNTAFLGLVSYPSPGDEYDQVLDIMNNFFSIVFNVEAALKLAAFGRNYFLENWNVFDFCCVVISDAFFIYDALSNGVQSTELRTVVGTIRIFRVARLLRLVRFLKGLNQLFFAFILSVPKLVNVAMIMSLLLYLYAVLGVAMFADNVLPAGNSLNYNANFQTFPKALSCLIRSMTGEAWDAIMHGLVYGKFYLQTYLATPCEDNLDLDLLARTMNVTKVDQKALYFLSPPEWSPNACGGETAYIYFITYTIVVGFVIINLLTAVIFEGFEESSKSEMADLINSCSDIWKKYDPDNRMAIPMEKSFDFVDEAVEGLCKMYGKDKQAHFELEPRWDSYYTGRAENQLPLYNLRYIRMLGLTTTPDREVRFVVAVKAVIRRIICQGGLNNSAPGRGERLARLRDLEALEKCLDLPRNVEKEVHKLYRMEQKQARIIRNTLSPNMVMFKMTKRVSLALTPRGSQIPALAEKSQLAALPQEEERSLLRDVAAAKVQLVFREMRQRKKEKLMELRGLKPRDTGESPVRRMSTSRLQDRHSTNASSISYSASATPRGAPVRQSDPALVGIGGISRSETLA